MKTPQFAERQFETAIYTELSHAGTPFIPTQNIEKYLGIDAAADPENAHAIWRILNVQIPQRIELSPLLWPMLPRRHHSSLPTGKFCSLFLQVKRANYQDGARSKYRRKFGGPYFETAITSHQQKTLMQLESRVKDRALTRYVSPVFWSRNDFDAHDQARKVIHNSVFISPSLVKTHRKWMYNSTTGTHVFNPNPEEIDPEVWERLIAAISERSREETLAQHVQGLAESIGGGTVLRNLDQVAWIQSLSRYGAFGPELKSLLYDFAVVAQSSELAGAWWLLLLSPDDRTRPLLERWGHESWWSWRHFGP